mgnify:CR=1 FL=1
MKTRRAARQTCWIMLIAPLCGAVAATPFPVSDQNPITRGFYHPLPAPARWDSSDGGSQVLLTVANTTNMNRRGGERLLVDAESTEMRWLWSEDLDSNWRVRASLPIVHYGGGILDPVIDGFHELFGLDQGSRPNRPDDELAIEYAAADASIRVDRSYTGIGDLSVEFGRRLLSQRTLAVSVWSGIELPTGNASKLTGNGALDTGLWFCSDWRPSSRLSFSNTVGGALQGSGDLLNDRRAPWVGFANMTARWDATPQLYLQAQFDFHDSYLKSTRIPLLGSATILTVGGGYRTLSGWRMGISVSEDFKYNTSPDVVFQLPLRPPFGLE